MCLTVTSPHLLSSLILIRITYPKKHNLFNHNTKNLNPLNLNFSSTLSQIKQDLNSLDWNQVIQSENGDPERALENFDNALAPLIYKYIPLQKVSNVEHKRKFNPWITSAIRSHVRRRDKLLRNHINAKTPSIKLSLYDDYKVERNNVVELTRKSKLSFYKSYFTANSKNLRKVWQGIKNLININ